MAIDWKNLKAAAEYVHRHPQTLTREVNRGRLRAAKVGGRGEYFFREEWLDEWMESQSTPIVMPLRRRG